MIRNLAYIGFSSPAAEQWRTFGPEILGAELAEDRPGGTVRLRVDSAAWRIAVHPGDTHDLAYLGWAVSDDDDIDMVAARLAAEGIAVNADDDLARQRCVARAAWFTDPLGFRHELTHGLRHGGAFTPGRPLSGFVTGSQGLGHAVLIVPDLDAAERFYTDVLGFRRSDTIGRSLRFLHCASRAARHHTVALVGVPDMVGMHHLMLEVESIDDVGTALDLVNGRQLPLAMGLGRHPNDLMISFYVRTPSGFEIEYGTGGVVVDDDAWQVSGYNDTSLWGHKPPAHPLLPQILRPFTPAGAPA